MGVSKLSSPREQIDPLRFSLSYSINNGVATRELSLGKRLTVTSRNTDARLVDPFSAWWRGYLTGETSVDSPNASQTLNVIDLFSSVGGLSLGFQEAALAAGFRMQVKLAADVDGDALDVYRHNHQPKRVANESVSDLVSFKIAGRGESAKFAGAPVISSENLRAAGKIDVVLAGPPCQGHSSLNNHSRGDDPRNDLYLTVPAIAIATGAKAIIIENVPNVVRDKQGVVSTTITLLTKAGYHVTSAVLSANKLGWPQTRRRYFLVATLERQPLDLPALAEHLAHQALPLSWAIGDLNRKPLSEEDVMFSVPKMSQENQARVQWLFERDEYNLPDRLRPKCHQDGNHTYPAIYGRMKWDRPAGTVTGGFLSPGRGRFIHPLQPRVLTPREAARVQGFPDWFDFDAISSGPLRRGHLSKWIGDAVPPILGYVAGLSAISGIR